MISNLKYVYKVILYVVWAELLKLHKWTFSEIHNIFESRDGVVSQIWLQYKMWGNIGALLKFSNISDLWSFQYH